MVAGESPARPFLMFVGHETPAPRAATLGRMLRPLPLVFLAPYPWAGFLGSVMLWRRFRRYRSYYDRRLRDIRSRSVS